MANRYWVGGSGTWNSSNTANWSTSPGGGGGASVPTSSDDVFFDQAGPYTVTISGTFICADFNVTGASITFDDLTSGDVYILGSFNVTQSTTVFTKTTKTYRISGNGAKIIRTSGTLPSASNIWLNFDFSPYIFNGTFTLYENLTVSSIYFKKGGLDINGKTVTTSFSDTSPGGTINFNGGTIINTSNSFSMSSSTITGNGTVQAIYNGAKNYYFPPNFSTIDMIISGTGSMIHHGATSFNNYTNTVQPITVNFDGTYSQYTSFNNFNLNGTAGNLVSIRSINSGVQCNLVKTSGVINASYLDIKDSNAGGGATWYSLYTNGNVNSGNNTGWIFGAIPSPCNFFPLFS